MNLNGKGAGMITAILVFILILTLIILSFCFHLAGGILKFVFRVLICLPCALAVAVFGGLLCCTVILIPLGIGCFHLAGFLINPFHVCAG